MDAARASDPPAATPGNTPEGETLGDRFDLGPEAAGLIPARRAETVAGKARPARKPTQSRSFTCHAHHLASPVIPRIAPREPARPREPATPPMPTSARWSGGPPS